MKAGCSLHVPNSGLARCTCYRRMHCWPAPRMRCTGSHCRLQLCMLQPPCFAAVLLWSVLPFVLLWPLRAAVVPHNSATAERPRRRAGAAVALSGRVAHLLLLQRSQCWLLALLFARGARCVGACTTWRLHERARSARVSSGADAAAAARQRQQRRACCSLGKRRRPWHGRAPASSVGCR
jgi:hypothetical protein